jgi:hypothetical protein
MDKIYRQGDVGLVVMRRGSLSNWDGLYTRLRTRTIRKGEHGGLHQLTLDSVRKKHAKLLARDGIMYLNAPKGARISHGTGPKAHEVLRVPPGDYEVRPQIEVGQDRRTGVVQSREVID